LVISKKEKVYLLVNNILLAMLGFITLAPFLHVFAKSLSNEADVSAGLVTFWPKGFNLKMYKVVLGSEDFLRSFIISAFVTVTGTILSVLIVSFSAYPLSKRYFKGRRAISFIFVFTMLFSAGMIPSFLLIKNLGLIDKIWVLIVPGLFSTFNMIIVRNYFYTIPPSLEESAKMDGASNICIFFRIYFPLSMPALATIAVYTAVGYWNSYMSALMYINKKNLYPLQMYLRQMVIDTDAGLVNLDPELINLNPEALRCAIIISATLPILLVYPFLQKYFVKGVVLGAVKE
jgi:putative aldouronate transport system permease protein